METATAAGLTEWERRMLRPGEREKKREHDRARYLRNREKRKLYYQENREKRVQYQKDYRDNIIDIGHRRAEYLCGSYRRNDREKGFDTSDNVTARWILENIFKGECIYCGEKDWMKLGCDRIDNSKPHTPDNCVCACWDCNNRRGTKDFQEFLDSSKKVSIFAIERGKEGLNGLAYSGLGSGVDFSFSAPNA